MLAGAAPFFQSRERAFDECCEIVETRGETGRSENARDAAAFARVVHGRDAEVFGEAGGGELFVDGLKEFVEIRVAVVTRAFVIVDARLLRIDEERLDQLGRAAAEFRSHREKLLADEDAGAAEVQRERRLRKRLFRQIDHGPRFRQRSRRR